MTSGPAAFMREAKILSPPRSSLTPASSRPFLAGFQGWALFCDCDFLWLGDVAELLKFADATKALHCVQHDYRPTETTKMDGQVQTVYPRKNWSSLMLFNCDHPSVRKLTPAGREH